MANLNDYIFFKENKYVILRIVWSCIYIIFIVLTIGLVLSLWQEFLTNPTVTTLESTYLPVNKIPYPGIAICNMNKISKKKATVFAKHV
jgi:hypothetical protein